jgi:hypothetical protein
MDNNERKFNMAKPDVECWDYCFNRSSHSNIWFGKFEDANGNDVCVYSDNAGWRYLHIADTEEDLLSDIAACHGQADADKIIPVQSQLHGILNWWRFIRYNGRNVCAMHTIDYHPSSAYAWPLGPVAPVRNAFVYIAKRKLTQEVIGIRLQDKETNRSLLVPIVAHSPINIIESVGLVGISMDELIDTCDIVVKNVLDLASEAPIVMWEGKPFPLQQAMSINPNHNGDPEEELLIANE